ncbi:hypothetical protein Pelo_17331 [Pelomyxa schiedti]|nr:hypothetical protein Pelo_17331 [Pelomyxa schiedti]
MTHFKNLWGKDMCFPLSSALLQARCIRWLSTYVSARKLPEILAISHLCTTGKVITLKQLPSRSDIPNIKRHCQSFTPVFIAYHSAVENTTLKNWQNMLSPHNCSGMQGEVGGTIELVRKKLSKVDFPNPRIFKISMTEWAEAPDVEHNLPASFKAHLLPAQVYFWQDQLNQMSEDLSTHFHNTDKLSPLDDVTLEDKLIVKATPAEVHAIFAKWNGLKKDLKSVPPVCPHFHSNPNKPEALQPQNHDLNLINRNKQQTTTLVTLSAGQDSSEVVSKIIWIAQETVVVSDSQFFASLVA